MESIKFSDVQSYLSVFPQTDDKLFIDVIYIMDDLIVANEVSHHNQHLETLKTKE